MNSAIIVGNGLSRKDLDIKGYRERLCTSLGQAVPIFGCNLGWIDFPPDYLVAIDPIMVKDCKTYASFAATWCEFIETPYDEQFEPVEFNPARPRNNAGMLAMKYAIERGYNHLYLFGMDFIFENRQLNEGNVYDGKPGYGPETRASYLDTINRCRFFFWFATRHSSTTFEFVYPKSEYEFRGIELPTNIRGKFYE